MKAIATVLAVSSLGIFIYLVYDILTSEVALTRIDIFIVALVFAILASGFNGLPVKREGRKGDKVDPNPDLH